MNKRKLAISATALILATAGAAEARCTVDDLTGNWDVYGLTDTLLFFEFPEGSGEEEITGDASSLDCVFRVNANGRLTSRSICVERATSGFNDRFRMRGEVDVRSNCTLRWDLDTGFSTCLLKGTITANKQLISGVASCDSDLQSLFNVVRRG
jgi:hypothetical protein